MLTGMRPQKTGNELSVVESLTIRPTGVLQQLQGLTMAGSFGPTVWPLPGAQYQKDPPRDHFAIF